MTKQEFLNMLEARLSRLPQIDPKKHLQFYEEMINDRIEDGMSEKGAVRDIGSIDSIYNSVIENISLYKIVKHKLKQNKKMSGGKIAIIASTSIVWGPVLIALIAAAFSVLLSLYATLLSLVISVWAIFVSVAAAAPAALILFLLNIFVGNFSVGFTALSAGTVSAGLAIFSFYGAIYSTNGAAILTKKITRWVKCIFVR